MYANLVKATITAIMFAAIAAAPLFAPVEVGIMATTEEVVASEMAGVGEGAVIEEVGEGVGVEIEEISTGSTIGTSENGGPGPGPDEGGGIGDGPGSNDGRSGSDDGRPGSDDGGPGSTGDGTNEPKDAGVKSPWNTKPSWLKRGGEGAGKKIGWHRVAKGKTNVVVNGAAALPVTVS